MPRNLISVLLAANGRLRVADEVVELRLGPRERRRRVEALGRFVRLRDLHGLS